MIYLGTIQPIPSTAHARWISLITSHDSLAPVPPRQGINPFTNKATIFEAQKSTAQVVANGQTVGSIGVAEDQSPFLNVFAEDMYVKQVTEIAEAVAKCLDAAFAKV